jgi:hypothetical protein
MPVPFTGGCYCGAVRYECSAEPLMMFNCHCRDCQQVSGGTGQAVIVVRKEALKFTKGAPRYHFTEGEKRGKHKRGFCAECGSRISGGETDRALPIMAITASSLDDPSWFRPQYDIFTSQAQPWDRMDSALPKHAKYPPR